MREGVRNGLFTEEDVVRGASAGLRGEVHGFMQHAMTNLPENNPAPDRDSPVKFFGSGPIAPPYACRFETDLQTGGS